MRRAISASDTPSASPVRAEQGASAAAADETPPETLAEKITLLLKRSHPGFA